MILTFECALESPGHLVKNRLQGPNPRVSDLVGCGRDLRIFISSKFPGYADAAILGTILGKLMV